MPIITIEEIKQIVEKEQFKKIQLEREELEKERLEKEQTEKLECKCGIKLNNICNCKISNFELMRINNQFICKNKNCKKWKCRCI